jgi:hypothetical protein
VFGTARLIAEAQKQDGTSPAAPVTILPPPNPDRKTTDETEAQKQNGTSPAAPATIPPPPNPGAKATDEFARLKRDLLTIFVGPAYSNILSVLLKGILAFFVAGIMKDPNIFGITVEKGNFYGFFTLGVFFGFWPLEKLLQKLAEVAGLTNARTDQKDHAGTPGGTLPEVSPG